MPFRNFLHLIIAVSIAGLLTGCQSARKSFQSGDYESAIEKAVKKLQSNRNEEESIIYLEAAYDKMYFETRDKVNFLRKENRPENAVGIYDHYAYLKTYESLIRPLLPLSIPSRNRPAQFKFISDEEWIETKQAAAAYLFGQANRLLQNGSRQDARQAYALYDELKCIYPDYENADANQRRALEQGTNRVNITIGNQSGAPLFSELEKEITSLPVGDLNEQWVSFSNAGSGEYDYFVSLPIRYLHVTPDLQLIANTYTDKKTVEDGFEYVLDARGNVMKDSLGNDIRKVKYKTISCIVTEYQQKKSSAIAGSIAIYQGNNGSLLYNYPVNIEERFEHTWATATGDLNALTRESAQKVKQKPVAFPTEVAMLLLAGDRLKVQLKQIIRDHMNVFRQ
jgi:hypothetical protein